ncbi:MAG TPA: hypothetical protein DF383_11080 [Deltaproteobacteria bacterium]|nr:hypothetical protein [Deltaproteobacteria bacterium]
MLRHIFFLALILMIFPNLGAEAADTTRFLLSGDGVLTIRGESLRFREGSHYNEAGLKRLNQIFGANWSAPAERLDLRFIEVLDYIQDHLKGGSYALKSGYRSPRLNQGLRAQGKLAAQSSMHIEGAAGDLLLAGVDSSSVFDFVKSLDCCGIGYYHSRHFHLDTGPSRYWDEKTSKTEDSTPQRNEKIIMQPAFDIYRPGESVELKLMRITEYPIGIPTRISLVSLDGRRQPETLPLLSDSGADAGCLTLHSYLEARNRVKVSLPKNTAPGPYELRMKFCNRYDYEKMPEEIASRRFEIRKDAP